MAQVMNPDDQGDFLAEYGPRGIDLWRPDPDGSGNLITEGELMERSFPRGEHGSRRLYDRMAAIRQLFATGVHEYNGAELAAEEHRSRELSRKGVR